MAVCQGAGVYASRLPIPTRWCRQVSSTDPAKMIPPVLKSERSRGPGVLLAADVRTGEDFQAGHRSGSYVRSGGRHRWGCRMKTQARGRPTARSNTALLRFVAKGT